MLRALLWGDTFPAGTALVTAESLARGVGVLFAWLFFSTLSTAHNFRKTVVLSNTSTVAGGAAAGAVLWYPPLYGNTGPE